MSKSSKGINAIESLAVRYHAYLVAIRENDKRGVAVWGGMLIESQNILGVEIIENDMIQRAVDYTNKVLDTEKKPRDYK